MSNTEKKPTVGPKADIQTLRDNELEAVSGGLLSATAQVVKALGDGLAGMARKG